MLPGMALEVPSSVPKCQRSESNGQLSAALGRFFFLFLFLDGITAAAVNYPQISCQVLQTFEANWVRALLGCGLPGHRLGQGHATLRLNSPTATEPVFPGKNMSFCQHWLPLL